MLESWESHNLMPTVIMERLGLDITRPYKDLYSFDSRKLKCLGLIKDLEISLTHIPSKFMVMDIMVAYISLRYGMHLSRYQMEKLNGVLQTDMSYIKIPVFGGYMRRLYRDPLMQYMINHRDKNVNHRFMLSILMQIHLFCLIQVVMLMKILFQIFKNKGTTPKRNKFHMRKKGKTTKLNKMSKRSKTQISNMMF